MLRDLSGSVGIPARPLEETDPSRGAAAKPGPAGEPPLPGEQFVQLTAARDHLRFVFVTRNVLLLLVCAGMAVAAVRGASSLMIPGIAGVVAFAAVLNLFTWLRLKRPAPVSDREFLAQILADIVLLSAALCFSGGDTSPFEDLYFVPLTIAAATLPWRHTLIAALAAVGCRELACLYFASPRGVGLSTIDHDMIELLSGALIAYFVFCMARTSRKHERFLAEIRENYLKQRHAAELGTMAAVAADQLSSPLATMAIVVGELRDGVDQPAERNQALEIIAKQIESCKQVSSRLLASAGYGRAEGGGKIAADKFCAAIVDKCQLMQPWMTVQCHYQGGPSPAPEILAESSLEQAILVLLKSAPGVALTVDISLRWDEKRLQIQLCDRGSCSRADAEACRGAPLFARMALAPADRIDLLMAKTTIGRFGGTVEERTHADGQVCVNLSLALSDALVRNNMT